MPDPITAILFRRVGVMEVKAIFPVRSSAHRGWFVRRYGPEAGSDQTDPGRALARIGEDVLAAACLTDGASNAAAHG
jgi:hypothetical protein